MDWRKCCSFHQPQRIVNCYLWGKKQREREWVLIQIGLLDFKSSMMLMMAFYSTVWMDWLVFTSIVWDGCHLAVFAVFSETTARAFLSVFGGLEESPGPALWKLLVCTHFRVDIREGIYWTRVRIIWADQTKNDAEGLSVLLPSLNGMSQHPSLGHPSLHYNTMADNPPNNSKIDRLYKYNNHYWPNLT